MDDYEDDAQEQLARYRHQLRLVERDALRALVVALRAELARRPTCEQSALQ